MADGRQLKLSLSNIALTAFDHADELPKLADLGFTGIEVAPSRIWHKTWEGLSSEQVETYRKQVEEANLQVVGLHSLFYDHPDLGLFKDPSTTSKSLDFLCHLSGVCRDLGGRTLIWGGARRRGAVSELDAYRAAIDFMGILCDRIVGHGTCFCFEPLGPNESDFINSALDALSIVEAVSHPALRLQLDAKALVDNGEAVVETFEKVSHHLVHFHANEPGLEVLGISGAVNHNELAGFLRTVNYSGYVSLEQRQLNPDRPMNDIKSSATMLREVYG